MDGRQGILFLEQSKQGINPLNGSDSLNNPDGDGYDVNMDGSLSLDEQLVEWLEYRESQIIFDDEAESGLPFPTTPRTYPIRHGRISPGSFGEFTSPLI